jgi:EAL domain-containing protein (putative c-di-GMP-specific phosphodiesterase class I)
VTPDVICRKDFHEHFLAQVERSGAPANGIHIEITEQSIIPNNQIPNNQIPNNQIPNNQIPNNQILINNLKVMKDYGIKVSLDDFGTGYSNLQIIAQYPVDIIKIDRSFLTGIVSGNTVMNNLLRSITDIAKNFGCSMVAEGIEQQAEAEHLLSLGCTHGQGYLFGKAMPLKELHALVMQQSA